MTGPAVDLAALRSARTALAAIVAEHPELTGATARARLAANLSEIIAMKPLDPNATGAARTITVRLSADLIARLEAERDRLAALVPGSSLGLSDAVRSLIHRALATPSTSAPAAPAPSRPIVARVEAVEAPAVDPRQLPLLAPVTPVVALHTSTSGASVATITGNDNATSTPKPKRTRRAAPVEAPERVDVEAAHRRAAEVAERLRALRDAEAASGVPVGSRQWTIRPIAERAGMSGDPVAKLMRGEHVSPAMIDKIVAILPAE